MSYFYIKNKTKGEIDMLDQNTDRGAWAMITLVFAGIVLVLVKMGGNEIGQMVLDQIKALFAG